MSLAVTQALVYLRKYLPEQGPLEFFVHHNTLHAFEDLPFVEALKEASVLYEAKVFKDLSEYQKDYDSGKISEKWIDFRIGEFLKSRNISQKSIGWVKELLLGANLEKVRIKESLFFEQSIDKKYLNKPVFFREIFKQDKNIDVDEEISPVLLRFFSTYFDQGVAYWPMPRREQGLLKSFKDFHQLSKNGIERWKNSLSQLTQRLSEKDSLEIIEICLKNLGISDADVSNYLFDLCYRYKGWAALTLNLEENPECNKKSQVKANFSEFVAILCLCETSYFLSLSEEYQKRVHECQPREKKIPRHSMQFVADIDSFKERTISEIEVNEFSDLIEELGDIECQYILHQAYEDTFYENFLNSFDQSQVENKPLKEEKIFQVVCCIDDREESFRRYIEALDSRFETFGVAGHFGLDINFKGAFDAHFRALCPNIIKPTKRAQELAIEGSGVRDQLSQWADLLWLQSVSSKSLLRGWASQFFMSIFSFLPLMISITSPPFSAKMKAFFKRHFFRHIKTKLLYRVDDIKGGFTEKEEIEYSKRILSLMGMTKGFARVVYILGHGSNSLNNPHEAAHDCGACGGGRGAPNARLIAEFLNKKTVRSGLKNHGILIPETTIFVGGYHNTCSNDVLIFDRPQDEFVTEGIDVLNEATKRDAKERCRRFENVSLNVDSDQAYRHVQGRAQDFRQPRPEYGHATNALCIVGPRSASESLYLDRRAFLVSYEPEDDPNAEILKGLLSAVGPVCSGINLEYYFSYVDNNAFGCGTKLPHNVTGLVGVMNGYKSDLLLGLPWQMVEIHDPYRLMLLVVCREQAIKKVLDDLPGVKQLVENGWIKLSIFDLDERKTKIYNNREFVPFQSFGISKENPQVSYYADNFSAFKGQREAVPFGILRSENVG